MLVRRVFMLFVLCLSFTVSVAQTSGKVTGQISSSDEAPLQKATVTIVNQADSSVISYTLTDLKGQFQLVKVPQGKLLRLFISHINAAPFYKDFILPDSTGYDFGKIKLGEATLKEVVITATSPIRMNKDSLEYSTDYFKVRPNANVEELLKELPGLQVNMDGDIYFQGRKVSAIRVNDKEFFNSDLKIASRNLDADLIKTVQVFSDRGASKFIVSNEANLPVVINLKLKRTFLRTDFGKIYGSGGTNSRYESGVLLNSFRDTLQVSLIGFANNINRGSFEYSELYEFGGLNRGENNNDINTGGRNYQGTGNNKAIGLNVNYDWKRTKVNFMYMFNYDKSSLTQLSLTDRYFDMVTQNSSSELNIGDGKNKHSLTGLVRHTISDNSFFEIRPTAEFRNTQTNFTSNVDILTSDTLVNNVNSNINAVMPSFAYRHAAKFETRISKKHLISIQNLVNFDRGVNDEDSRVSTYLLTRQKMRQDYNKVAGISYLNRSFSILPNYQINVSKSLIFQLDLLFEDSYRNYSQNLWLQNDTASGYRRFDLENRYRVNSKRYSTNVKLDWRPKEGVVFNFSTAFELRNHNVNYDGVIPDRRANYFNLLPTAKLYLKDIDIGWQRSSVVPSFSVLRTRTDNSNELQIKLPFFDFQNVLKDNWSLNYRKYGQQSQFTFGASLDRESGSVGIDNSIDVETGSYSTNSYLAGQTLSSYNYLQYFKGVKISENLQAQFSVSPTVNVYQNYTKVNMVENRNTSFAYSVNSEISLSWKNLIKIYPKYNFTLLTNQNTVQNNHNFVEQSLKTYSYGSAFSIGAINRFSLEASYVIKNLPTGLDKRDNIQLLDSSLYYNFKSGSQIKLTGFDILNQNTATYWTAQNNEVSFQETNVLNQYFLLGFVYKLKSTKLK
ncbi:carboxypeptidase-like regulatory domain-containing protein [Pedobacter panaciterrae]|uniref:carboxypeptidase-like regulatory domain-containing protein n=1 Tax=Pedobacter panaciterrae TaxID=363849 RepID=UPI00259ABE18|nr:carboxypeptidase-like regulatory domain-containing protein [uncultured Pedobacter sp.]